MSPFLFSFQSVTTRSAGLSTMDVSSLTEESQLFMSFLMFIGASPSSAGGGIRTTTFALVIIYIIASVRGEKIYEFLIGRFMKRICLKQ